MTNLYEVLDVKKDATADDIKKAYRRKAQQHHPDKPNGDNGIFNQIMLAKDVLTDDNRRRQYDETGNVEAPTKTKTEENLLALFNAIIERDLGGIDIIKHCRERTSHAIQNLKSVRQKQNVEIARLSKQLARVKCKKDHNLFEAILTDKIKDFKLAALNSEEDIKTLEGVLKLLDDYEDTRPEQTVTFYGNSPL